MTSHGFWSTNFESEIQQAQSPTNVVPRATGDWVTTSTYCNDFFPCGASKTAVTLNSGKLGNVTGRPHAYDLELAVAECCYEVRTMRSPFHCCEAILRPRHIDLSMIFSSHGGNSREYPRCKVKRKEWLIGCHGETALTRFAFMRQKLTVSARRF